MRPARLWTVGHSTAAITQFLALLTGHGICALADVRRFPSSRRNPQFNASALAGALRSAGITYAHFPALGGRREPAPDSPNAGWREPGFRGFADYMGGAAFTDAMDRLLELAAEGRTAMMCAEKDWRECHRGLISDWLKCRGVEVHHILSAHESELHPYTAPARVDGGVLRYPGFPAAQATLDF